MPMHLATTNTAAACLGALLFIAAGCHTANQGTSTLTTSEETAEPSEAEPVHTPDGEAAQADDAEQVDGLEHDTCRPGAVYRTITLDEPEPASCTQICADQMRCMAVTYMRPGYRGEQAQCDLKHSVPDEETGRDGCISWVNPRAERRMAQMRAKGFEWNVERPGGDFRDFAMDRPEPESCKEACENLRDCKAFTYVRPGEHADKAHCYLKDRVPDRATGRECCISGLK